MGLSNGEIAAGILAMIEKRDRDYGTATRQWILGQLTDQEFRAKAFELAARYGDEKVLRSFDEDMLNAPYKPGSRKD